MLHRATLWSICFLSPLVLWGPGMAGRVLGVMLCRYLHFIELFVLLILCSIMTVREPFFRAWRFDRFSNQHCQWLRPTH